MSCFNTLFKPFCNNGFAALIAGITRSDHLGQKGQDYIHTKLILWYTDSKVPEEKKQLLEQLIVDNLPKEDREDIMRTVADSYIDEGINKGIAIGKNEGIAIGEDKKTITIAKTMISKNYDFTDISDVTGLSKLDLQKISKSL